MDDQIVRNESGPSGSKSTTYYVTEQPSDNEDIVETYQTQAFTDGDDSNLEIISIADDDPQYSTITTEANNTVNLDMADKSKWKGKNLSYMTPQMMHALKMSQTQSQNTYKKTYNEEMKGKGSSATDTVEGRRVKKLTTEQSLLNYHKDFEKSKSKGYTTTTETPELQRIRQQCQRDVNYKKEFMEQKGHNIPVTETPDTVRVKKQQKFLSDIKYQEDREKLKGKATQVTDDPLTRRAMNAAKIASDIQYKKSHEKSEEMEKRRQEIDATSQSKVYKHVAAPGKVADYDPEKHMKRMSLKEKEPDTTTTSPQQLPEQVQDDTPEPEQITVQETVSTEQDQEIFEEFVRKSDGHIYKAMYDYEAQDDDEVSFSEGDTVINAQRIDDGWMFGTVERTGQTGMLPSNYVDIVQ